MISFNGKGILLDIEGTTSSVSFVYDVMFPFARDHVAEYVASHWETPELQAALEYLAQDANQESLAAWISDQSTATAQATVVAEALRQMEQDAKATGLKQLQGLVWRGGFESDEMKAHVYDDVPAALSRWQQAGLGLRIYSSGSIGAQKLFFGHTEKGNLLDHFSGHYDTTIGGKKESDSYRAIIEDIGDAPGDWLFISDIPAELDAAAEAGLEIALSLRPGNAPIADADRFPSITSFDQVELGGSNS